MSRKMVLGVFVAVAVFAILPALALAQEEGGEAEVSKKSLWDLFKSTGFVGILLVLTSLVGTALLIQYMVNVTEQKLGNQALLSEVEALVTDGNLDEAFTLAQSDKSYSGQVLAGALSRSYGGYEEVKTGFYETSAVESFRWNAKISLLSLVGNIGPLLGLLGTVTGMISSFQVIESLKSPTPGDMAKGVYESLVNTTMGLFIAVVFLSAYFFMKNKLSDILLRLNNEIGELLARTISPEAQAQAAAGGGPAPK